MKTFAIRLKGPRTIEGIEYPADFQIGALTSEVGPLTLLGLVQYRHATIEEVTDSLEDDDDSSADGDDGGPEAGGSVTPQPPAEHNDIDSDPPPEESSAEPPADDQQGAGGDGPIAAFIAAGLDQKTAEALVVANQITSIDELTALLADPQFNLMDLDDIGSVRAEKIKAVFSATAT